MEPGPAMQHRTPNLETDTEDTMHRKILLALTVAAMAAIPGAAAAQSTATQGATVTATVIAGLTLAKNQDLDYGSLATNSGNATVDPTTSANAASFTVGGQPSTPVSLSWVSSNLTNGANTISYTPSVAAASDPTTQGSATAVSSGDVVTLSASGAYGVWVGGTINVGAVATGTYNGSFTLTVAY